MVKGGLGSRHERATDGYFVAPKIKKFIRQYPGRQPYFKKLSKTTIVIQVGFQMGLFVSTLFGVITKSPRSFRGPVCTRLVLKRTSIVKK